MPWPSSTAGGAWSPYWGGYVKLWARAAIAAGQTFHIGAHSNDRLSSGNVLGGAPAAPDLFAPSALATPVSRLWIDLSCDVRTLSISGGASSSQGVFSKPDAAVCELELADPEGIYDPLSSSSPYTYSGRSRLQPGVPLEVFAEVVNATTGAVTTHRLFKGRVESWGEDWTPRSSSRSARVIAADETHTWVRFDQPEQPPAGGGDTTAQRVQRLATFYGWTGTIEPAASSTVTLAPTTFAQSGWELLQRTLDDELGYVYFTPAGRLRWLNRAAWSTPSAPVVVLGCDALEEAGDDFRDVLVDVSPTSINYEIRNNIYAARTGGSQVNVRSSSSISRFGRYDYQRTDLGLDTDPQVGAWAAAVLNQFAFPQIALDDVTLRPAVDPSSWTLYRTLLDLRYVEDLVRIVWAPPDIPENVIDGLVHVVGHTHSISRHVWETKYVTASAGALGASSIFTMGADAQDRLDAGYVLA